MRIVAEGTLRSFALRHPAAKPALLHWRLVVKAASWQSTQEVLRSFSKAKVLNAERVRFEVAGGSFRLIAAFDFRLQIAFIKFVGTHAEYDAVDGLTVSLF
ncbi:MAG TPA: type II toxin-antitoxin system HigB family toxin [Devosia sp.]|jgi:mRNA interferase HigB|uniref:type II toxin-antitoxin system HigB family toxin n=1 Tax=Devosia sp. TaxID=1871048 RepID=UPI002F95288F